MIKKPRPYHTIDCLEERGVERRKRETIFLERTREGRERDIVKQTNIGTV